MEEIHKPSKGEELLNTVLKQTVNNKQEDIVPIKNEDIIEQEVSELQISDPIEEPTDEFNDDQFASVVKGGVEIVDVKIVPKGIPNVDKRKTWDKI